MTTTRLPTDAVAWLDMGKGEAQLLFRKRDSSNRANKRQLTMLFEKVPPGYHPLYLHPQAAEVGEEMVGVWPDDRIKQILRSAIATGVTHETQIELVNLTIRNSLTAALAARKPHG